MIDAAVHIARHFQRQYIIDADDFFFFAMAAAAYFCAELRRRQPAFAADAAAFSLCLFCALPRRIRARTISASLASTFHGAHMNIGIEIIWVPLR